MSDGEDEYSDKQRLAAEFGKVAEQLGKVTPAAGEESTAEPPTRSPLEGIGLRICQGLRRGTRVGATARGAERRLNFGAEGWTGTPTSQGKTKAASLPNQGTKANVIEQESAEEDLAGPSNE